MQLYLVFFVLGGLALSYIFNLNAIANTQWYLWSTALLLAIGLYGSTYGISLKEAKKDLGLLISAVTIGVIVKALIIGTITAIVLKNPFGFILGIIVAQIDPLSTAAIQKHDQLSQRAKTIMGAWASFDDPMTVILAIYLPVVLGPFLGLENTQIGTMAIQGGILGYVQAMLINIVFAVIIFFLWKALKHFTKSSRYIVLLCVVVTAYLLMFFTFSLAIYFFWMLGIALIGLFMRPRIEKFVDKAVQWALCMATVLLGVLLFNGVNIFGGIVLGIAAFLSQMIVGTILCRNLPRLDRLHIAIAQQNGITAIILALLFEPYFSGTIAIVAPAVMTVNLLHFVSSKVLLLSEQEKLSFSFFLPAHHKLKKHL